MVIVSGCTDAGKVTCRCHGYGERDPFAGAADEASVSAIYLHLDEVKR